MIWLAIILLIITIILIGFLFWIWIKRVSIKNNTNHFAKFWQNLAHKGSKFKIGLKFFGLFLLIGIVFLGLFNLNTRIAFYKPPLQISGNAEWRQSRTQQYLYVEAEDRYSFGYLQGKYLAIQISNFRLGAIAMGLVMGISYQSMIQQAQNYLPYIPQDYIIEMQGIADGASQGSGWIISFDDILLQNVFLDLSYGHWIPKNFELNGPLGCTDIAVKNPNGTVVLGQNFDFPKELGRNQICSSLSFVHSKLKGCAEIFGLRLGAMLSLPVARTSYNYTIIVTVIESTLISQYMMPAVIIAREALEQANSMEAMIQMISSRINLTCSFSNLLTNGTDLYGIQVIPIDVRVYQNITMVHTNRYIYNDWNEKYFADGNYSTARQLYTERLVREYNADNDFTYEELVSILGTRENGFEGQNSAPCYTADGFGSATLAVFTTDQFGVGTVYDGLGENPI